VASLDLELVLLAWLESPVLVPVMVMALEMLMALMLMPGPVSPPAWHHFPLPGSLSSYCWVVWVSSSF
jgi:hypothetical protein